MCVMAIPAKPGLWQTIKLKNGTEVRARLCGDEHAHFWMDESGQCYAVSGDDYVALSAEQLQRRNKVRVATPKAASRLLSPRKVTIGERTHYMGQKKGVVILAQFTDVKFKTGNDLAKYKRILNEEGYSEGKFKGSVADYFKAQSAGQFELDFDVVGPYTLKNNQKYYGSNDSDGNDLRPEEMVVEACKQANAEVDFKDYDWDGDGEVDQVFVVYAGKGEADGGNANTIWPHMWSLAEVSKSLTLDSVKINNYACSNEIDASGAIEGIGCFCHEFSHCMGFPDFYDTSYSGWFGMDAFDLMCSGSYNGSTFLPAGYTAHEKMMCGWQDPIVLGSEDVTVENLQPMSKHGDTYIIYNEAHPDEYFMIENRQKNGWDAGYPAKGLMITHVDFDQLIWQQNSPNTKVTAADARMYGLKTNDHERMTIVHADNDDDSQYWNDREGYYEKQTLSTDLYPYSRNDSLTPTSKPSPALYNKNKEGKKTVDWAILGIKQNSDGTMNFRYRAKSPVQQGGGGTVDTTSVTPVGDYLFYESFDLCQGKGGNDDVWSSINTASKLVADNDGWECAGEKAFAGDRCARFGTSSVPGVVTSPSFTVNGTATLTFKAGAWNSAADGTSLLVEVDNNATVSPSTFTMQKGAWSDFTATITGQGSVSLTFTPGKRFFLDEVKVVDNNSNAIRSVTQAERLSNRIYTLDGRFVGTDFSSLRRGIYVVNGKKVIR